MNLVPLNITWCVHFDYSFFSLPHPSAYGNTHAVLGLHGRLFLSMLLSSRGFYIGFFAQTLLISAIFCLSVCRWAISVCFRVAFSHVSWFMMSIPVFQASCSRLTTRLVITIYAMRAFGLYAARKRIWPQSIAMAACSYYINRRCHFLLESEHFEPSGRIVPVCVWRIAQREYVWKDLSSFRNRHRSCFELSLMSPFARAISECVLLPSGRKFKLEFAATVRHYRWPWKKYIPSQSRFAMARKRLFSRFTISKDPRSVGIWIPILFSCLS